MTVEDEDGRPVQRHRWNAMEKAVITAALALLVSLTGTGIVAVVVGLRTLAVMDERVSSLEAGQAELYQRSDNRYTSTDAIEDQRTQRDVDRAQDTIRRAQDQRIDLLEKIVVRLETIIEADERRAGG